MGRVLIKRMARGTAEVLRDFINRAWPRIAEARARFGDEYADKCEEALRFLEEMREKCREVAF